MFVKIAFPATDKFEVAIVPPKNVNTFVEIGAEKNDEASVLEDSSVTLPAKFAVEAEKFPTIAVLPNVELPAEKKPA